MFVGGSNPPRENGSSDGRVTPKVAERKFAVRIRPDRDGRQPKMQYFFFRHAACCNLLCDLKGKQISLVSTGQLMGNDAPESLHTGAVCKCRWQMCVTVGCIRVPDVLLRSREVPFFSIAQ